MKFGPVVQEEMLFKENVYGRMDDRWMHDGQRPSDQGIYYILACQIRFLLMSTKHLVYM